LGIGFVLGFGFGQSRLDATTAVELKVSLDTSLEADAMPYVNAATITRFTAMMSHLYFGTVCLTVWVRVAVL
jgi:hypothetical protein